MAGLQFLLILGTISFISAAEYTSPLATKHKIIVKDAVLAMEAIQNISSKTPNAKIELERIANDFIFEIDNALFTLNTVIPNLVSIEDRRPLSAMSRKLSGGIHSVQISMNGNFRDLKGELEVTVEKIKNLIVWYEVDFKIPTDFVLNQLGRKNDYFIYGINKLKYQAIYFSKSNLELIDIVKEAGNEFNETISSLPSNETSTEIILRRLLLHLAVIDGRVVYKLTNWLEVNKNNVEGVKSVNTILAFLNGWYALDLTGKSVDELKTVVLSLFESGIRGVISLAKIKYPDNLGGQELIRSIIMDAITVTKVYSDNFKIVVSKPEVI